MNQIIILLLIPAAAAFLIPLTRLRHRAPGADGNAAKSNAGGQLSANTPGAASSFTSAGTTDAGGGAGATPAFSLPLLITLTAFAAGTVYGAFLLPVAFEKSQSVIIGNWLPPFGINLYFSPLTVGAALLIYISAFFVTLFDGRYTERKKANYYLLYALMVFSSIGMVLTGDLFNLFVFLEIGGIAAFACTGAGNRYEGAKGGVKHLIQGQLLSLLMLAGIIFVYSASGVLNIAVLAGGERLNPLFGFLAGVLILLPLFLETKQFPFNTWVPDVYRGAPSSFAGSLSSVMALAGGIALMRLFLTMMNPSGAFALSAEKLSGLIILIGSVTVVVGELAALHEKELKKVLGYSSVGQMGMIAVGIGAAQLLSIRGAVFLVSSHTAAKLLLFLVTGFLIRTTGKATWNEMRGIGRSLPLVGGLFAVGAMTLMGLPLFAGFWGKLALLKGVLQGGGIAIVGFIAVLIGTVIEGIYFMRIGHGFFTVSEGTEERTSPRHFPRQERPRYSAAFLVPAIILAAALLFIGVYPKPISPWLESASEELSNPDHYVETILPQGGGM